MRDIVGEKKGRCAFLLSSCDDYEDVWIPFFELMDKYWRDCPYPVFINTETKSVPSNICTKVTALNCSDENANWGKRMLGALRSIENEYVLVTLEDYFICDTVDDSYIEEILDIMDADKSIASFQLSASRYPEKDASSNGKLKYHDLEPEGWKTHFVPTIWRKSVLERWIRPYESIWGFELYGSNRARRWNYPERVCVVDNPFVYKYVWLDGCSAVLNGRWLKDDRIPDLFASNGISVDFSSRGWITLEEYRSKTMADTLKRYSLGQIIVRVFNRLRSFF